jgi:hypothetical protein
MENVIVRIRTKCGGNTISDAILCDTVSISECDIVEEDLENGFCTKIWYKEMCED